MYTRETTFLHCLKPGASGPRKWDKPIDTIVVHYTATQDLGRLASAARGLTLCERAAKAGNVDNVQLAALSARYASGKWISDAAMLCLINSANKSRTASWHYCVGSKPEPGMAGDVEIVEYVDPSLQAHHVGAIGLRTNVRSIGIECCYPGPAPRRECPDLNSARKWYAERGWADGAVFRRKDPSGLWRYWAQQPDEQREALRYLCLCLCQSFPTINAISSHYLFAPKKRIDPDPPISLADLREHLTMFLHRPFFPTPEG